MSIWIRGPITFFADSCRLSSTEALERYIKQCRHLPEIPTAEEVKANGVDLGAMNALLLKKIEKLTPV